MSSPEAISPAVVTAQELLAFDEGRLLQFLDQCRVEGGGFDISRVAHVDKLSGSQREEFAERVNSATDKAGPDPIELARRLWDYSPKSPTQSPVPERNNRASDPIEHTSRLWASRRRSPTQSPDPEGNNRAYEAFCYDELVKAGGRPAWPIEVLLRTSRDEDKLEPWLPVYKDWKRRDDNLPPVFSTQRKDWLLFQHRWQWDNRGKIACEEDFSAFLDSEKKELLHKREVKEVSDPWYEYDKRKRWEDLPRYFEASGSEGFKAYAQAVAKRLASHNFTQPFQLAEDPRQQDGWTTWVEYLNFGYWWQDRYTASLKASEPNHRKIWEDLGSCCNPSAILPITGTPNEKLKACRALLDETCQKIHNYNLGTDAYRTVKSDYRRQKLRVQWVLEQLPLIEAETSLEYKAAKNDAIANNSKKRKLRDSDDDTQTGHQSKRRGQGVGGGDIPSGLDSNTVIESRVALSSEKALTSIASDSRPRRSQSAPPCR
ncbi:MAG: hypothetical protein Q9210_002919 [Variospora velana]